MKRRFAAMVFCLCLCVLPLTAAAQSPLKIDIKTHWPDDNPAAQWPMTFGLPFAQGVLTSTDDLAIIDDTGKAVPAQFDFRHRWPDDSARWIWCSFQPTRGRQYHIARGNNPTFTQSIKLTEADDNITVETSGATYTFKPGKGCFDSLRLNGELLCFNSGDAFVVTDSHDRRATLVASELKVELQGPGYSILRVAGSYQLADNTAVADAVVYFHFYADQPRVRISHRFILTQDTNKLWFKDIALKLPIVMRDATVATHHFKRDDPTAILNDVLGDNQTRTVVQDEAPHFSFLDYKSRLLVNGNTLDVGEAAGNWVDVSCQQHGIAAQLPEMVEMFPAALAASKKHLIVKLFASESGKQLDFRTEQVLENHFGKTWIDGSQSFADKPSQARGTARVHDIWLYPHTGKLTDETRKQFGAQTDQPFALPDPQWTAASRVMGWWHPRDREKYPKVEAAIDDYFTRGIFISKKVFPTNGYYTYGMYPFVAQGWEYRDGRWFPKVHRLSRALEYNLRRGVWMLTARSAEPRYYQYARRYTRYLGTMLFNHRSYADGRDTQGLVRHQTSYFDSPIVWDSGGIAAFASSVDVIQFVYDYYLAADLHSRDVLELYKPAATRVFSEPEKIVKFFRPDSALRTFGSLYEYKHDQEIYALCDGALKLLADDDAIISPVYRTNFGKAADVFMGYYYCYSSTGIEEAGDILRKLGELYFHDARMVGGTTGRSGGMLPAAFALLYKQTNDPALAAWLNQMLRDIGNLHTLSERGLTEADFGPTNENNWGFMTMTGQSSLSIGAPLMMAALEGKDVPDQHLPVADKPFPIQPTALLLKRTEQREDSIVIWQNNFGDIDQPIALVDNSGKRIELPNEFLLDHRVEKPHDREGWHWSWTPWYYNFETHRCTRVTIPRSVATGIYRLDVGDEVEFAVLYSTIDQMQQYAPNGLAMRRNVRYYFDVPDGLLKIDVFSHRPVVFTDPDGKEINLPDTRDGWAPLYVKGKPGRWSMITGRDDRMYGVGETVDTFVDFKGAPLIVAQDNADRLFAVNVNDWQLPKRRVPNITSKLPVDFVAGRFGKGAAATGGYLELPFKAADFPKAQGTIEFWMQPLSNSTDITLANSTQRLDLLNFPPIRMGYFVDPDNGGRTGRYNVSRLDVLTMSDKDTALYPARLYMQKGKWLHVAFVWRLDGKQAEMDLFINGRKRSHYNVETGSVAHLIARDTDDSYWQQGEGFLRLGFGRRAGRGLDGFVYDELRLSDVARYTEDFQPAESPTTMDDNTLLLMHRDGDTTVQTPDGQTKARIQGARFLY